MSQQSGKLIVPIVVAATVLAVGVGTIYLPFYVDKAALRGEGMTKQQEEAVEQAYREELRNQYKAVREEQSKGNNMWSRMNDASKK
jgi:flagellar basal body-associated protein FliL